MDKYIIEESTNALPHLDIGILPKSGHEMVLGNMAVINDNLERTPDCKEVRENTLKLPMKMLISSTLYCISGSTDVRINQSDYHIEPNSCLFIMPGAIIEKFSIISDCKVIVIHSAMKFAGKVPFKGVETARKWLVNSGSPAVLVNFSQHETDVFVEGYRFFRNLYNATAAEFKDEITLGFLHSFLTMLSSWIIGTGKESEARPIPRKKEIGIKFLNDVHEFCSTERSVAFYADRCFLSPKYFARIISDTLGKKPGEIIKDHVILEAKVLLVTESYTVQQVSDKLNFPNASFFCKYFKSATGFSPKKYQMHDERPGRGQNITEFPDNF